MHCKVGDLIQLTLLTKKSNITLRGESGPEGQRDITLDTNHKLSTNVCTGLIVDLEVKRELVPVHNDQTGNLKTVSTAHKNVTHIRLLVASPPQWAGRIVSVSSNRLEIKGVQTKVLST